MSAELLREAAAKMRERATGANDAWGDGRWTTGEVGWSVRQGLTYDVHLGGSLVTAAGCEELAEHIASWHPAVALAVADWLEAIANRIDEIHDSLPFSAQLTLTSLNVTAVEQAVSVARAYLGTGDA